MKQKEERNINFSEKNKKKITRKQEEMLNLIANKGSANQNNNEIQFLTMQTAKSSIKALSDINCFLQTEGRGWKKREVGGGIGMGNTC